MHGGSQFINVTLHGTASARDGKLDLLVDRLRVGHLEIPQAVLRLLSPALARAMDLLKALYALQPARGHK